ncbi:hypothetical protein ES703_78765 [subsurface metagenome]
MPKPVSCALQVSEFIESACVARTELYGAEEVAKRCREIGELGGVPCQELEKKWRDSARFGVIHAREYLPLIEKSCGIKTSDIAIKEGSTKSIRDAIMTLDARLEKLRSEVE